MIHCGNVRLISVRKWCVSCKGFLKSINIFFSMHGRNVELKQPLEIQTKSNLSWVVSNWVMKSEYDLWLHTFSQTLPAYKELMNLFWKPSSIRMQTGQRKKMNESQTRISYRVGSLRRFNMELNDSLIWRSSHHSRRHPFRFNSSWPVRPGFIGRIPAEGFSVSGLVIFISPI